MSRPVRPGRRWRWSAAAPLIAILSIAACTQGDDAASGDEPDRPYAGQQGRDISTLSDDDVAALLDGEGFGYALPAELNSYPGPAHVLDLADELNIDDDQLAQITQIERAMRTAARDLGDQLVAAEWALDEAFRNGTAADDLDDLTSQSAAVEADLRAVHLQAHVETTDLLDTEQIETYNRLRGYGDDGHHTKHGSDASHDH
jgi:hypothetical protein